MQIRKSTNPVYATQQAALFSVRSAPRKLKHFGQKTSKSARRYPIKYKSVQEDQLSLTA